MSASFHRALSSATIFSSPTESFAWPRLSILRKSLVNGGLSDFTTESVGPEALWMRLALRARNIDNAYISILLQNGEFGAFKPLLPEFPSLYIVIVPSAAIVVVV